MKRIVLTAVMAASLFTAPAALAEPVFTAVEVTAYTPGSGVGSYTNTATALGLPDSQTGFGVLSPFNPPFSTANLLRIGEGGSVTLRMERNAVAGSGFEIGVFENIGLIDTSYPNGVAGNSAGTFGSDSATVEVSADGTSFVSLGTVNFEMFANYWTDLADPYSTGNGTVASDFAKPYTGSVSDFAGMNYSQIVTQLGGSAGGTWLSLASTGLSEVGWVRFSGVAPGQTLELDALTINRSAAGAATVPEPSGALLALLGVAAAWSSRRRLGGTFRRLALLVAVAAGASSSAEAAFTLDDVQFWIGTGTNRAGFVIDWQDGKTPQSLAWGYRWNGSATGLDMLMAIDATDVRLSILPHPSYTTASFYGVYAIWYDLNGDGSTFAAGQPDVENGSATDATDHYREGWSVNGFWNYFNGPDPYATGSWSTAQSGVGTRALTDGGWDGWSFTTDLQTFSGPPPGEPAAAVPEPSALALVGIGSAVFACRRR